MIGHVLTLFKTLVNIILFRKGPDAVPRSTIVMAIVVIWWLATDLVGLLLDFESGKRAMLIALVVGIPGLMIYAALVKANGQGGRVLQMLTAVIGCGALFGIVMLLLVTIVAYLPKEGVFPMLAVLAAWGTVFWSIAVDGHILSRTMDVPRLHGNAIAITVAIFQYYLINQFTSTLPVAS